VTASALPESVILANTMETLSLIQWTLLDQGMWVPNISIDMKCFLDCHALVLAGHMGRDKTDQVKSTFII
jgi:hypothetical protein